MNKFFLEEISCSAWCCVFGVRLHFESAGFAGRRPIIPLYCWPRASAIRGTHCEGNRCLRSIWSLQLCYRGVVYHGVKWQCWRLANLEGSMEEFWQFCQDKASTACKEIACF